MAEAMRKEEDEVEKKELDEKKRTAIAEAGMTADLEDNTPKFSQRNTSFDISEEYSNLVQVSSSFDHEGDTDDVVAEFNEAV